AAALALGDVLAEVGEQVVARRLGRGLPLGADGGGGLVGAVLAGGGDAQEVAVADDHDAGPGLGVLRVRGGQHGAERGGADQAAGSTCSSSATAWVSEVRMFWPSSTLPV